MGIILPAEGDTLAVEGQQAVIGNGDAMRVAAQVAEQLGGFAEGWLGVNDPLLSLQSMQQPGKQFPVLESGGRAAAVEPSVPARCNPILPFNSKRSRLPNPAVRGGMATPVGETGSKVRFARHSGPISLSALLRG